MNHKYESRLTRDESRRIPTGLLGINHQTSLPAVRLAGDKINMQNKANLATSPIHFATPHGKRVTRDESRVNMQNKPNFKPCVEAKSTSAPGGLIHQFNHLPTHQFMRNKPNLQDQMNLSPDIIKDYVGWQPRFSGSEGQVMDNHHQQANHERRNTKNEKMQNKPNFTREFIPVRRELKCTTIV